MTKAEKAFIQYTEPYKKYGEKIQLKIGHTFRVKSLCADIAVRSGLRDRDAELSEVCGLLHDIGRFEQWRRYRTYNDQDSADHGDLGAAVLNENGLINAFSETDHDVILQAVKNHNKYIVPDILNDREKQFLKITRDADKIDILNLFIKGGLVNHSHNSVISGPVYQTLLDGKTIRKQDMRTKADRGAVCLAFVYDLNFRRAFEIVKENDLIDRLISVQTEEAENYALKKQLEDLRPLLNRYVEDSADKRRD